MKKRIISAFLSTLLIITSVLTCLSGCSSQVKEYYTVLQWLDKVEDTFNLLYYSETEPLVKSTKVSEAEFDIIQIAAEWGIINPEDDLNFNDRLTKEFAADTLIRAMNCVKPSTVEISDSKSINPLYLENVMSSVNEEIFTLNANKFEPKKKLTMVEANNAMIIAFEKWVNFSYGESFDKSIIKENVINLGGVTSENSTVVQADYSVEYSGSKNFFDENGGYVDNTEKTITFPYGQAPNGLEINSVLAMPADDVVPMNYAVVVTGIETNNDGSVTAFTRKAELQDVYDEINIQQSEVLDFNEAVFYGPDGQRIDFDNYYEPAPMLNSFVGIKEQPLALCSNAAEMKSYKKASYMSNSFEKMNGQPLTMSSAVGNMKVKANTTASKKIELNDNLSMKLYIPTGKTIKFEINGKVEEEGEELSLEFAFEDSIQLENKIRTHWDWLNLKIDELRLSTTNTMTETFNFTCSSAANFGKINNIINDNNKNGHNDMGDWAKEGHKLRKLYGDTRTVGKSFESLSKKAKEASNKKLLDIIFPSTNIHFVVRAELTVEGSLKLTLTQSNTSGVELLNGSLRPIKAKSHSQKLDFAAEIELTFRAAFEFQLIGINVADVGFKAGIGANAGSIVYSYDEATGALLEVCGMPTAVMPPLIQQVNPNNDIQITETALKISDDDTRTNRICLEMKVYPILTIFACSPSSVAGKLFGSIEAEMLNEKSPLYMIHYEIDEKGGRVVNECSITANENYGITTSNKLTLNMDSYAVKVDEESDTGLAIVTLPKKSTVKDITITSDNPDVLEVENLMNKTTLDVFPKPFLKLKITSTAVKKISKKADKLERTYNFGIWFYDDLSGGAKPQFALTGKKDGVANVTVTVNGEAVTIPVKVGIGEATATSSGALIVNKGTFVLSPGETAQAAFDFIPEDKTISDISFTCADSSVASVSSGGLITAKSEGDTVITATLHGKNEDYITSFVVHVIP